MSDLEKDHEMGFHERYTSPACPECKELIDDAKDLMLHKSPTYCGCKIECAKHRAADDMLKCEEICVRSGRRVARNGQA